MLIPPDLTKPQIDMVAEVLCQRWRYQMMQHGMEPRTANRVIIDSIAAGLNLAREMASGGLPRGRVIPLKAAGDAA